MRKLNWEFGVKPFVYESKYNGIHMELGSTTFLLAKSETHVPEYYHVFKSCDCFARPCWEVIVGRWINTDGQKVIHNEFVMGGLDDALSWCQMCEDGKITIIKEKQQ